MSGGWIKLHRKLLDSSIFTSDSGLRIWIWCLLRANHDECDVFVGIHKVHLMPGQFIFGRESASESLGISPSTVRNWINILQQDSRIDIKPTNKYSVISVLNWNDYQSLDNKKDNRITTEKQQNNTDKNEKNEKNIYINENPLSEDSSFEKEMQDREQEEKIEETELSVGEQYLKSKTDNAKPNITQEFQYQALELIKALHIPKNRQSAYFLAVKKYPRDKILDAFAFVADYPKPEIKDKMFFWKLNKKDENK